ncbi:MAG: hypothetical protein WD467_02740 [Candidatus Saccharimonadales bacterium]
MPTLPLIVVGPVLVTSEPASMEKLAAVPSPGEVAAWATGTRVTNVNIIEAILSFKRAFM